LDNTKIDSYYVEVNTINFFYTIENFPSIPINAGVKLRAFQTSTDGKAPSVPP